MYEQNILAAISAQYIAIGANTLPDIATRPKEYQDRVVEVSHIKKVPITWLLSVDK